LFSASADFFRRDSSLRLGGKILQELFFYLRQRGLAAKAQGFG